MEERRDNLSPDVETRKICVDMAKTQAALVNKLQALQDRVMGTVETVRAAVEQTVATVEDSFQAVQRTLDLKYQAGQRPWQMVGGAVAVGSVVGYFIGQRLRSRSTHPRPDGVPSNAAPMVVPSVPPLRPAHEKILALPSRRPPGVFAAEQQKLRRLAVGVGMALIRDWLKEEAPQYG